LITRNICKGRVLMKWSAIWFDEEIGSNSSWGKQKAFLMPHHKWQSISKCFVHSWKLELAAMQRVLLLSQYKIGIVIYRWLKPMHDIPLHNLNKQWWIASLSGEWWNSRNRGIQPNQNDCTHAVLKEKFYKR
jgi:hypothetical protein